jgi:hypothetical protein
MLGRDNLGGEVVPREELTGTENILQVKDWVIPSLNRGRGEQRGRGNYCFAGNGSGKRSRRDAMVRLGV